MAFQPGSVFLHGERAHHQPQPMQTSADDCDELHWSAGCSRATQPNTSNTSSCSPPIHSTAGPQMLAAVMAAEQQVSLEQQLAASILMHRQRLLQQAHLAAATNQDAASPATPATSQQLSQLHHQRHQQQHEQEEEEDYDDDDDDDKTTANSELLSEEEREPLEQVPEELPEQEQALNLSINSCPASSNRKPPVITQSSSSSSILQQQASISHHHQPLINELADAPLETHLNQTASKHLLLHHSNPTTHHNNNNNNQAAAVAAAAAAASLTSHLSRVAGHHATPNPFNQLAASLVSSTSSTASSASSSSGWSSAADSLASCSPDRAPQTRSPAHHHHHQQLHNQSHHNRNHQQQSPNNLHQHQQHHQHQQQYQHPHKPLFLHHLHQHHHELGPVHKTDSDDLDRIRNFIELFKARRGALGLTQKQAAQCFRAYTNDRYAFSDNFVGHFEGFQFRPQTAMTIADSLAEWLEYAENETRQGRQLNFMPGRVKETRKRKYEVIRIRDSAKRVLVEAFEKNKSPSTSELEQLSRKTNIPSRNIEIFFKNRRTSRQYHQ